MKPATLAGRKSSPGKTRRAPSSARSTTEVDGRRERSRTSRSKIVLAMVELVRGGEADPSATQVAALAGVGLRTVFRHFDDMETLYRAMAAEIEQQVMPLVLQPFTATDWKGRVREIVERRSRVFEMLLPFRISANAKRHESPFIMESHQRMVRLERAIVESVVSPDFLADRPRMHGLILALSFQAWLSLRQDQGLEVGDARTAVLQIVADLLAQFRDPPISRS